MHKVIINLNGKRPKASSSSIFKNRKVSQHQLKISPIAPTSHFQFLIKIETVSAVNELRLIV